ncbi:MAG: OsmC family protein [Burkholderiaceae bacterium]|nr:OsmC family protein [Burkholderiaceae bacterium]
MNPEDRNHLVRIGSAQWTGTLAKGQGHLSTASGALQDQRYAFATRFAQERGTNPEELIAAAHAGCYCMALAYALGQADRPPEQIEATASLSLQLSPQGPSVTGVRLKVRARVPGISAAEFAQHAQSAKASCLVSRLLNVEVALDAMLLD